MRAILLLSILFTGVCTKAQDKRLNTLPPGKYETSIKGNADKWERGDIIIMDDKTYKITSNEEVGDYRFSATAQRIFFTSGPLKGMYAKTSVANNEPAILLPVHENEHLGLKLAEEVWCYYKQ